MALFRRTNLVDVEARSDIDQPDYWDEISQMVAGAHEQHLERIPSTDGEDENDRQCRDMTRAARWLSMQRLADGACQELNRDEDSGAPMVNPSRRTRASRPAKPRDVRDSS